MNNYFSGQHQGLEPMCVFFQINDVI